MLFYLLRRVGLVVPTLIGILTVNFFLVQMAPGGPVEQFLAQMEGSGELFMERLGTSQGDSVAVTAEGNSVSYIGSRGLPPDVIEAVKKLYGFDKPLLTRYTAMLRDFLSLNFGNSLFKADTVLALILKALPVSISLGLWSTLILYSVAIPLGIARAVRRGSAFDTVTGLGVVIASAIPGFLLAVLLIVLFAGGSYWQWFPLRGLYSASFETMPWWKQFLDYLHHMALPVLAMSIGSFAGLSLFTRNAFLDELGRQYVETARAKGLSEKKVLYFHVFRNAMLLVIAGLPGTFVRMFFTGSLLIETIFSLNGLGLLGFEAAMQRDYPLMFATLYIFTLVGLLTSILGDISLMLVDPRIDFSSRRRA